MIEKIRKNFSKKVQKESFTVALLLISFGIKEKFSRKCLNFCDLRRNKINFPKIILLLLKAIKNLEENRKYKEKLSCDLWLSLPDMKVTQKQMSWTVLKNLLSVKKYGLKNLLPDFTVTFRDIFQNNEKLISSNWERKVEYGNPVSVSSRPKA